MSQLIVRALRTTQKLGIDIFSFFLPGSKLIDIANISRIKRNYDDSLEGFQRKEMFSGKHLFFWRKDLTVFFKVKYNLIFFTLAIMHLILVG